jgi:type I restriction enzyme M protein
MNLALRRIQGNIGSHHADTFHNDLHPNLKADYILANPPFNMSDWGGEHLRQDPRWRYGIPPINNANFAWVQQMVSHLASTGVAGFVLSNGALNHTQGDGEIREALIEADLIDCIVALPNQLFYTTQIAASLWFIAGNKQDSRFRDRKGQTLFIYAYSFGEMVDRTHCILTDAEISRIAKTYQDWRSTENFNHYRDIPGFCRGATSQEIRSHKMSLVPGRYVGFDEELTKHWDIERLQSELADVETRLKEITKASNSAFKVLKELLHG